MSYHVTERVTISHKKGHITHHLVSVINRSFHQVFHHYSFPFLLLYFTIYSMGNSVTPCDLMRDRVTSKVMVMVTGHVTHSLVGSTG